MFWIRLFIAVTALTISSALSAWAAPQVTSPEGFYDCNGAASGLNKSDISGGCCLPGEQTCNKCFYTKLECENEFGCDTSATNQGCGCNEPAPGACGCNRPNLTCNTPPKTLLDSINCACVCPTTCLAGQTQNSTTCACSCPTTCPAGQTQNSTTCACGCSASPACTVPKTKTLANSCACSCPKNKPHNVNGQCSVCPKNQKLRGGKCITPSCDYYALQSYWGQYANALSGTRMFFTGKLEDHRYKYDLTAQDKIATEVEFLPCMQRAIRPYTTVDGGVSSGYTVITSSHAGGKSWVGNSSRHSDDHIANRILSALGVSDQCTNKKGEIHNVNCRVLRKGGGWANGDLGWGLGEEYGLYDAFYMDDQCNVVPKEKVKGKKVCPKVTIASSGSPISLLMDDEVDVEKEAMIVNFPIDPNKTGVFSWKASSKAPLLAIDSLNTGKITSAKQLFGDWTFGGKQYASMKKDGGIDDIGLEGSQWQNGFEALSSLDSNFDKEISGKELDGLVLWFDNNRNGISEEGEVRTLEDVGITKLFYSVDHEDKTTRALYVTKGYEGLKDGKIIQGRSVDWYGEHGLSASELISKATIKEDLKNINHAEDQHSADQSEIAKGEANPTLDSLKGAWLWMVEEPAQPEGKKNAYGNFVFTSEVDSTELKGASIVESVVAQKSQEGETVSKDGVSRRVDIFRLTDFSSPKEGEVAFQYSDQSGSKVVSTAVLDKDEMHGESTYMSSDDSSIRYKWIARRIKD